MAYVSKLNVNNTDYDIKDTAAGKSLSLSGSDLSLKNASGTDISTVTLPVGAPYKSIGYDNTNNYFTYNGVRTNINNIAVGDLIYFSATSSGITYPISIDGSGVCALILYGFNSSYGGESTSSRKKIKKLSSWFLAKVTTVASSSITAFIIACANTVKSTNFNQIDRLGFVVNESSATITAPKIYAPNGDLVTISASQYVEYQDGTFAYHLTVPSNSFSSGSYYPGRMDTKIFDFICHVPSSSGNYFFYGYYYDASTERYKTFANEGIRSGSTDIILYGHTYT